MTPLIAGSYNTSLFWSLCKCDTAKPVPCRIGYLFCSYWHWM